MNRSSVKRPSSALPSSSYTIGNSLTNYYLLMMFGISPLFLTEQYARARMDKYFFYITATVILILSVGITMLFARDRVKKEGGRQVTPVSSADILFLCFIGFALVSTLLSPFRSDAFLGTGGRNNGLLLLLLYALMYFFITRNYAFKSYVFIVYLVTSSIVALLTVLNFYYIDPIGIFDGYGEDVILDFGSTIGNKNIIATFMCLFLPVSVMLFVISKSKTLRTVSGVAIVFAYTGLLCADSSSDILGLFVILPVMAIFSARSFTHLRRFLLAMTILFASSNLLLLFERIVTDRNKGFEFMQEFLVYHPLSRIPMIVCVIGYILMLFLPKAIEEKYPAKAIQIIFSLLFLFGIIAIVWLFIHFSFIDKETDIGNFEKLLRFDDYWGTHRGFMWRVSFEEFGQFTFLQKLFGMGPDTVYYVLTPHFAELSARFGDSSTDCAHNEFINYLLTQGILGLTAYLGLMGAVIVRGIKSAKNNPIVLIFLSAVICYLAQSVVNLYNPIVTPTMFIFLSLAEAMNRQVLQQNNIKVPNNQKERSHEDKR